MNILNSGWIRCNFVAFCACAAISALAAEPTAKADAAAKALAAAPAAATAAAEPARDYFARVGDQTITLRDYAAAFQDAVRKKFYHGKPPEDELRALRREVGETVIDDMLVFQEATRRKVEPDTAAIDRMIAGYEERYSDSPQWQQNRERLLPGLRRMLERQSLIARMRQQVLDDVAPPADYQIRAYYDQYPQKFTEPEQVHLLSILLKVDPSSSKDVWEKALQEGKDVTKQLAGGADFAELARLKSGDVSAKNGGDMGWLHVGVLPPKVQKVIDTLKVGVTSEPFMVLEGVAVVRLLERKPAERKPYDEVRQRATQLLAQEQRDDAWRSFVGRLRASTQVTVNESVYAELAKAAPKVAAPAK